MLHKNSLLVLALLAPVLLFSAVNLNQANVLAATTEQASSTWTDTPVNQTVHTKNLDGLPIYDANGQIIERASATPNFDYMITVEHRDNNGNTFYKIQDNQYLSSDEILTDRPDIKSYNVNAVVHTLNLSNIPVYDGNGNQIAGATLTPNTNWYTNKQINNNDTGISYYQVATNRFVSSEYIDTYKAI